MVHHLVAEAAAREVMSRREGFSVTGRRRSVRGKLDLTSGVARVPAGHSVSGGAVSLSVLENPPDPFL